MQLSEQGRADDIRVPGATTARASDALATALPEVDAVVTVGVRGVAEHLDAGVAIWLADEDGALDAVSSHHRDPGRAVAFAAALAEAHAAPRPELLEHVLRTGNSIGVALEGDVIVAARQAFGTYVTASSGGVVAVALEGRERRLGVLALVLDAYREVSLEVVRTVEDHAKPIARALENALLIRRLRDELGERRVVQDELAYHARLLDWVNDAVVSLDETGRVRTWNAAAERLYGYSVEEVFGRPFDDVVHTQFRGAARLDDAIEAFERTGHWQGEVVQHRKDGTPVHVMSSAVRVRGEEGRLVGTVAVNRDVTELRRAERELAEHSRLSRAVLDTLPSNTAVVARDGTIVEVNRRWTQFAEENGCEAPASCAVGANYLDECRRAALAGEPVATRAADGLRAVLAGELTEFALDYPCDAPDEPRWFTMQIVPLEGFRGAVVTHTDITWRKLIEARLAHQATHDPLTGLPNRVVLTDRLEHALARIERQEHRWVAVFVLDVDRFKSINDTLGHEAGDRVLTTVAERLRASVRPGDTVARFGGDEFVVLAEDLGDPRDADEIAERITAGLRAALGVAGRRVAVSASVGFALSSHGAKPDDLLRDADAAMYRAKAQGRDRWCRFEPSLRAARFEAIVLEQGLREAIEAGQLTLEYQPVIDLHREKVVGAEALVRWQHPRLGPLRPSAFVPLAEQSGAIHALGRWVLQRALDDMTDWPQEIDVSVNLSAAQLDDATLVRDIEAALDRSTIDSRRLVLEVTETALMADPIRAATVIDELRRLGVRVVIDDFGTGYSSLEYLKRFQPHGLKIDRAFVAEMDPGDLVIVEAIMGLARALDIHVTAEGVETETQLVALRQLGCDAAQGYLLGRPVPVDRLQFGPSTPR